MSPQNNKNEWKVTKEFNNQRIDYWLKKKITNISYPILCKFIRKGVVRINGKRIKNSSIINTGDLIKFSRIIKYEVDNNKQHYNEKFSEFIKSLVLFKDQYSIILNKPTGLAVQGGSKIKLNIDLMLDSLKFDLESRPRLVHRIDKQTSGILLVARTLEASKYFGELFKKRLINKKYLALVNGRPKFKSGKIILPIKIEDKELESTTYFKQLAFKDGISLLLIKPITGRKHQIRSHLNSIGNPIIGENKFKNKKSLIHDGQFYLHAFSLKFKTINGGIKDFEAPLPEHFNFLIEKLDFEKSLEKDLEFKNLSSYKIVS